MESKLSMPEQQRHLDKMPGHWVLAKLGKKVLRPGGRELTEKMLAALKVSPQDKVVEFAPGLGFTARLCLAKKPAQYTAIEQNQQAADIVKSYLNGSSQQCLVGRAQETGLADKSATVVYGEAMLTMQTEQTKAQIMGEAARLLAPGGRYGIHELCIVPDTIDETKKREIQKAIAQALQVPAKPVTVAEWQAHLESQGFTIDAQATNAMGLLEPKRVLQDEGWRRTAIFLWNLCRYPDARRRALAMRKVFKHYKDNLRAVMLVGKVADKSVNNA